MARIRRSKHLTEIMELIRDSPIPCLKLKVNLRAPQFVVTCVCVCESLCVIRPRTSSHASGRNGSDAMWSAASRNFLVRRAPTVAQPPFPARPCFELIIVLAATTSRRLFFSRKACVFITSFGENQFRSTRPMNHHNSFSVLWYLGALPAQ